MSLVHRAGTVPSCLLALPAPHPTLAHTHTHTHAHAHAHTHTRTHARAHEACASLPATGTRMASPAQCTRRSLFRVRGEPRHRGAAKRTSSAAGHRRVRCSGPQCRGRRVVGGSMFGDLPARWVRVVYCEKPFTHPAHRLSVHRHHHHHRHHQLHHWARGSSVPTRACAAGRSMSGNVNFPTQPKPPYARRWGAAAVGRRCLGLRAAGLRHRRVQVCGGAERPAGLLWAGGEVHGVRAQGSGALGFACPWGWGPWGPCAPHRIVPRAFFTPMLHVWQRWVSLSTQRAERDAPCSGVATAVSVVVCMLQPFAPVTGWHCARPRCFRRPLCSHGLHRAALGGGVMCGVGGCDRGGWQYRTACSGRRVAWSWLVGCVREVALTISGRPKHAAAAGTGCVA